MAESSSSAFLQEERISKEAPQLTAVLKEMKEGLDAVTVKIQALTAKVKAGTFPTSEGISYLEAKHLLLLSYCQSLVYYLLSKANGLSIEGHPVVRSLVEIRLFLEKIRPIDKKLQYQIQKLTRTTTTTMAGHDSTLKETDESHKTEDLLKYRPNPDLLETKVNPTSENGSGVYRPPKLVPVAMEDDKMSRQERNALRKDKQLLRESRQNEYIRHLMNDLEGKPEEITEDFGTESRELMKFKDRMEHRSRQEEELFTRAPLTKLEKKKLKHLKKPRNGLLGITNSFYDEIKSLPIEGGEADQSFSFNFASAGNRKFKKRKVQRHGRRT